MRKLKKLLKLDSLSDFKVILKQILPFEMILLSGLQNINFCTSSIDSSAVVTFFVKYYYYYYSVLCLNCELDCVYFPAELVLFRKNAIVEKTIYNSFIYLYCYYKFTRIKINFFICNNKLKSLTGIYRGLNWVEREIKEFKKIFVCGLVDSRKLLTSYFVFYKNNNLYCENFVYDTILYELY
jgi:hypothetical protein